VEMTKCDPNGTPIQDQIVGMSGVYTSWKRVFIERDKMFRKGGVLAEDYVPWPNTACSTPGNDPMCSCTGGGGDPQCCSDPPPAQTPPQYCNQMVAYDWQNAAAGEDIAVFDELSPYETAPELRTVKAVGNPDSNGRVVVTLDRGLRLTHLRAEPTTTAPFQPTFSNHHSAGFGVVSGCDLSPKQINQVASGSTLASCFYDPDMRGVERPFADAFVEFVAPRDGMGAVPYLQSWFFDNRPSGAPSSTRFQFSQTWFAHWTPDGAHPTWCLPNNFFHLFGVSESPTVFGLTTSTANLTYLMVQTMIDHSSPGVTFFNLSLAVTNHEFGHQYEVNPCQCDLHDNRSSWCAASGNCGHPSLTHAIECLMNVTSNYPDNLVDGVDRFGVQDLMSGTSGCTNFVCSQQDSRTFPQGYGAIRTMSDPR